VGSHVLVPLEAHAFALDSRFTGNGEARFPSKRKVLKWISEDRYAIGLKAFTQPLKQTHHSQVKSNLQPDFLSRVSRRPS